MQNIVQNSLKQSLSYQQYRKLIDNLHAEGKVTGHEQSEFLTTYSELNVARMKRLDKTIQIPEKIKNRLNNLEQHYIFLVLTEGWCGDAAQIVPVLNKMTEASNKIELKLALRDDNNELMELFLTNGSKSIPKLIVLDAKTRQVLSSWGPRPAGAAKLIIDYKAEHGIIDDTAKTELQKWYLKDKGISTMQEIIETIEVFEKTPI
ncbi:MAG: thioredoxin family protein [Flavobacteriaceae bacterium]|jgi:polyhydroxyalkanoate synthesis regulator phasin|nr:thioredoxin family protein [Flavobacteriaceae bacterium]